MGKIKTDTIFIPGSGVELSGRVLHCNKCAIARPGPKIFRRRGNHRDFNRPVMLRSRMVAIRYRVADFRLQKPSARLSQDDLLLCYFVESGSCAGPTQNLTAETKRVVTFRLLSAL
jgi:hypothetical protein